MANDKKNLLEIAGKAQKVAGNFIGKTKDTIVKITDQNDDGELNLQDVAIL